MNSKYHTINNKVRNPQQHINIHAHTSILTRWQFLAPYTLLKLGAMSTVEVNLEFLDNINTTQIISHNKHSKPKWMLFYTTTSIKQKWLIQLFVQWQSYAVLLANVWTMRTQPPINDPDGLTLLKDTKSKNPTTKPVIFKGIGFRLHFRNENDIINQP